MNARPYISRHSLSRIFCPVQQAALEWWKRRNGVAETDNPTYRSIAPHLQISFDLGEGAEPIFFHVGDKSLTAQILGAHFTTEIQAGGWWNDGGYANAVSGIYEDVSASAEPALETIKAQIRLPHDVPIVLYYDRLCLPTAFNDGERTFTIVTSQKSILRAVH